ncbi:hypothetical protein [Deferrisoma sp.]
MTKGRRGSKRQGGTPRGRLPGLVGSDRPEWGLWPMVLFVALCLWVRRGCPGVPDWVRGLLETLGPPPPVAWIDAVFVLYAFSAMVLSLTRMARPDRPGTGFQHLGYLAGFFLFYGAAGALRDHYWALLVGGLVILSLEAYRHWLFLLEGNQEGKP